jgi:CDP-glycerol glycerophosphotransferase
VAWDAAFLRRHVGFFQFDQQRMLVGARGPHIDLETQLPGPVLRTVDETVAWVDDALATGARPDPEMVRRADAFLQHRDTGACARIYAVARRRTTLRDRVWRFRADHRATYDRFREGPRYRTAARLVLTLASLLPRRNLVVLESDRGARYGDSPRAVFEHLQTSGTDAELVYVCYTSTRLPEGPGRKIRRYTLEYFWLLGRARYWVTNQNLPDLAVTPRGTTYVQTWHGTPLKKMQHDVPRMAGRAEDYQEKAAHLTRQWDVLVSPSPYASRCFESAFRFEGRTVEIGYPRNDVLLAPGADARRALVRRRLGVPEDRLLVLYAPTFRDDQRVGAYWRQDLEIDLDRWRERLGGTAVLAVRFHNLVRDRPSLQAHADVAIDVSRYPDTQELLLAADVLVTDYSSIMFDFGILERPMVFLAPDLVHFRSRLRGFYADLEQIAPGPVVTTDEALLDQLDDVDALRERWRDALAGFRATYAPWDDGNAARRLVEQVMGDLLPR